MPFLILMPRPGLKPHADSSGNRHFLANAFRFIPGSSRLFVVLLVVFAALAGGTNCSKEGEKGPKFDPGILLVIFYNEVHYDSALAILKDTGYQVIDMGFVMEYYHSSSDVNDVIAALKESAYVYNAEPQTKIVKDGRELYPVDFWTKGVTTAKYYYDLLRPFAGGLQDYLLEGSGIATIKVPVGMELQIAGELEKVPGIVYAAPNYIGQGIIWGRFTGVPLC